MIGGGGAAILTGLWISDDKINTDNFPIESRPTGIVARLFMKTGVLRLLVRLQGDPRWPVETSTHISGKLARKEPQGNRAAPTNGRNRPATCGPVWEFRKANWHACWTVRR